MDDDDDDEHDYNAGYGRICSVAVHEACGPQTWSQKKENAAIHKTAKLES